MVDGPSITSVTSVTSVTSRWSTISVHFVRPLIFAGPEVNRKWTETVSFRSTSGPHTLHDTLRFHRFGPHFSDIPRRLWLHTLESRLRDDTLTLPGHGPPEAEYCGAIAPVSLFLQGSRTRSFSGELSTPSCSGRRSSSPHVAVGPRARRGPCRSSTMVRRERAPTLPCMCALKRPSSAPRSAG